MSAGLLCLRSEKAVYFIWILCLRPTAETLLLVLLYESRTESHEQLFFACELGTADEGDCGGR